MLNIIEDVKNLFIVISPSGLSKIIEDEKYVVVPGRALYLGLTPNFYKRSVLVHDIQE